MTSDPQLFTTPTVDDPTQDRPHRVGDAARAAAVRAAVARRSALWAAYGDALGWISELTDEPGLRRRTRGEPLTTPVGWKRHIGGRGGLTVLLPPGCYSDDTQLRLATSRAIGPNGFDVEAFAKVELPVWLAYALGGGNATKAAAGNLAKASTPWFVNTYRGWLDSGGNGAAMRIQPHVWAAAELADGAYLLDVARNSICTHAHPVGLVGAVTHALALAHTMTTGELPQPDELTGLLRTANELPALLSNDAQAGQYWLTSWERHAKQPFADTWRRTVDETLAAVTTARDAASSSGRPSERYQAVVDALQLREEQRRGSGQLTAIAAVALAWCERRPADALVLAANTLGTDTDTIATMAGALLGAACSEEPAGDILDRDLITAEADRLTALATGTGAPTVGHRYPDLLTWSAPKTQADALVATGGDQLHVLGLGDVRNVLGEPLPAQGEFAWQWVHLAIGQSLLIKRRTRLATIPQPGRDVRDTGGTTSRRRTAEARRVNVLDRPQRNDERHGQTPSPDTDTDADHRSGQLRDGRQSRPLDLDRAIAYLHREGLSDQAIGYTVRRVAREGTPEQLAAFLAVLLDLIRH